MSGTISKLAGVVKGATYLGAAAKTGLAVYGGYTALNDISKLNSGSKTNTVDIAFPNDLLDKTSNNYYIAFKFSDYVKRSIYATPTPIFKEGIKLPIPSRLSVDTKVHYNQEKLGSAVGAAVGAGSGLISGDRTITGAITDIAKGVGTSAAINGIGEALGTAAKALGTSTSIDQIRGGASALTGLSINPFLAVLFDSPEFRSYNFSWKLFPRSEQESLTVKEIIKKFQRNTLPELTESPGLFYKYPSIVDIAINTPDKSEHLFQFKKAVIESFNVNYNAGNSPAFFRGTSASAAIEITMNIKEIELWSGFDYLDVTGGNIS